MICDKNQLVRVISLTDAKLRKENRCKCCGMAFQKVKFVFQLELEMIGIIVGNVGIFANRVQKFFT